MKLEPVKFSSTHHTLHCNPQLRERLKCACVTFNLILTATHSDILTVPKLLLSFFFSYSRSAWSFNYFLLLPAAGLAIRKTFHSASRAGLVRRMSSSLQMCTMLRKVLLLQQAGFCVFKVPPTTCATTWPKPEQVLPWTHLVPYNHFLL